MSCYKIGYWTGIVGNQLQNCQLGVDLLVHYIHYIHYKRLNPHTKDEAMQNYITAETISEELGVTPKTVREWLKSGELVGIKVGNSWRIHRTDFDRYIEGQRLEALMQKAMKKHPDTKWVEGQCSECGEYMVTPIDNLGSWVCSTSCKIEYDRKWATILDRSSEEYTFNCGTVVPYF